MFGYFISHFLFQRQLILFGYCCDGQRNKGTINVFGLESASIDLILIHSFIFIQIQSRLAILSLSSKSQFSISQCGWKRSTSLPQGWMFRSSTANAATTTSACRLASLELLLHFHFHNTQPQYTGGVYQVVHVTTHQIFN